jgi:hypothetical protein
MYYLMASRRTQLSSGWPHAGSDQWLLYDGTWERFCNIIRKLVDNFLYLKMFSMCQLHAFGGAVAPGISG